MSAKQLGPQEVKSLSLYEREADWKKLEELLADGLESGEDSDALVALVEKAFLAVQEKRDSFCAFMAFLENQSAFAGEEIERINARKKRIEAAGERLKKLAVQTIQSLGPDDKGKWKRLEGKTSTLSLAKNPASVEVLDDREIPDEFKQVTLTMTVSMATWAHVQGLAGFPPLSKDAVVSVKLKELGAALKEMLPCEKCGQLGVCSPDCNCNGERGNETSPTTHTGKCAAKDVIVCPKCNGENQVPRQVPGARLVTDRVRLVRK